MSVPVLPVDLLRPMTPEEWRAQFLAEVAGDVYGRPVPKREKAFDPRETPNVRTGAT